MSDRLRSIYERVTTWQRKTFPRQTAAGVLAHMRKELAEIEDAPHDIEERADMAILAMGYVDRTGEPPVNRDPSLYVWGVGTNQQCMNLLSGWIAIMPTWTVDLAGFIAACSMGSGLGCDKFLDAIEAKLAKNMDRTWPSPDQQVPGQPVEHIRDEDLQFDAVTAMLAADARDEAPSEVEILRARVAELEEERVEWRADNECLRREMNAMRIYLEGRR